MSKELKPAVFVFIFSVIILILVTFLHSNNIAIFNPAGVVAAQERNLIIIAICLMLLVLLPMLFCAYFFAWKYRSGNKKAKYDPEAGQNLKGGVLWLIVPALVVLGLGIVVWSGAHNLDPYRSLNSKVAPLSVGVVALDWKWLFLYPKEGIATINYLEVPEGTPVNFQLTADGPMNSFWIPELGGQIYAMTGMSTQLHLEADSAGEFRGQAAEINGQGYSGMNFKVKSVSPSDFNSWVKTVKESGRILQWTDYNKLSQPSENNPAVFYSSYESDLYNKIILKYMAPNHSIDSGMHM